MKLKVGLNKTSIKNAVEAIKTARKQLGGQMVNDLLIACCDRIIERANANLDTLDLGANVINGIKAAWVKSEVKDGRITLTNTWHKPHGKFEMAAAYVEFGVGLVGGEKPHEEAGTVGWEYNVPSDSKDEDGTWAFYTNTADLDLPSGNYFVEKKFSGNRLFVSSQGTEATRFLYNAVMRFANENEAEALWQQIKAKYWG